MASIPDTIRFEDPLPLLIGNPWGLAQEGSATQRRGVRFRTSGAGNVKGRRPDIPKVVHHSIFKKTLSLPRSLLRGFAAYRPVALPQPTHLCRAVWVLRHAVAPRDEPGVGEINLSTR